MTHLIRILLADDHPIVRAGVRAELEKIPGAEVVAEAADGRQALELVAAHKPDLLFIDISMPNLNGLETAIRVTRDFPGTKVIILSRHKNEEYVWQALKAGAAGYLVKSAVIGEIAEAARRVHAGEIYLSRDISDRFLKKFPLHQIAHKKSPLDQLTERQREILQLIAEGQTTIGIGLILNISPKTVEYHRAQLMDRLKIHDIPGLVRFALRTGLISTEV
ncbi:MAG TPA: response regulator transcription factor [Candidatus Paceibacterota bacterium]|nr:response regulator transcription factor [Candidatus Paceibacterota bacterium]HRT58131.1 response regulator transcription factor [Candidatus Paceibacterota bacterium]